MRLSLATCQFPPKPLSASRPARERRERDSSARRWPNAEETAAFRRGPRADRARFASETPRAPCRRHSLRRFVEIRPDEIPRPRRRIRCREKVTPRQQSGPVQPWRQRCSHRHPPPARRRHRKRWEHSVSCHQRHRGCQPRRRRDRRIRDQTPRRFRHMGRRMAVRGALVLWLATKDGVRSIDFSSPADMKEVATESDKVPHEIRESPAPRPRRADGEAFGDRIRTGRVAARLRQTLRRTALTARCSKGGYLALNQWAGKRMFLFKFALLFPPVLVVDSTIKSPADASVRLPIRARSRVIRFRRRRSPRGHLDDRGSARAVLSIQALIILRHDSSHRLHSSRHIFISRSLSNDSHSCAQALAGVGAGGARNHRKTAVSGQHGGRKGAKLGAVGRDLGRACMLCLAFGNLRHAVMKRLVASLCTVVARLATSFPHALMMRLIAARWGLGSGATASQRDPRRPCDDTSDQVASCPHCLSPRGAIFGKSSDPAGFPPM